MALNSAIYIKQRHQLIWENIIAIGNKLLEVKKILNHGQFLGWITKEFQWSDRYARNFMTISTELSQIGSGQPQGIAPTISNLSMRALSQLAYSLKDTDSESEKTALLEKIDLETDLKGEVLSESEIKKIRDEIESQYRSQQTDLFYKLECFASEKNQLASQLEQSQKFKQLYEQTYQEKRHLEQQKQNLDSELESVKLKINQEKENAVKDYVSKHSQDLESKKEKLEKESNKLEAEITARETNLLSIKAQLDYAKNL